MVERPERHAPEFVAAGADAVTFHVEATPHAAYAASMIRDGGAGVGVAINPATPAETIGDLVPDAVDLVLCMTVNPGWGGQTFIEHSLRKLPRVRELAGPQAAVEVDGGVDAETARRCLDAGANVFVAGSAIFGDRDPARAYRALAEAIGAL
jgi:ribulose-phosphate 3-epimerase